MARAVFVPVDGHTEADDFVMGKARRNAEAAGIHPLPPYQGIYIDPTTRDRVHLFTDTASLREFHQRQYRPAALSTSEREAKKRREQAAARALADQEVIAFEGVDPGATTTRKGEGE
jgi:hypothetical protein